MAFNLTSGLHFAEDPHCVFSLDLPGVLAMRIIQLQKHIAFYCVPRVWSDNVEYTNVGQTQPPSSPSFWWESSM